MHTVKDKLENLEKVLRQSNQQLYKSMRSKLTWKEKLTAFLTGVAVAAVTYIIITSVLAML